MLKPGVDRTGVDNKRKAELFDVPEPLEIGVLYEQEQEVVGHTDEAMNRVVDDLSLLDVGMLFHVIYEWYKTQRNE
jgi:hypothetical protein